MRLDAVQLDAAVESLSARPGGPRSVHLCNAYTLSLALRDPDLEACLNRADLNLLDGTPLVWIARALGFDVPEAVAGADVMAGCLDRGRSARLRHYLYGSTPEVIDRLKANIDARWPGAEIVGAEPSVFRPLSPTEEADLVARVRAARPDLVWVGLGTPLQDLFVDQFRDRMGATLVAVGAAFDFHAGTVPRAPTWMRVGGLEWLHRLAQEPRRLWRRYLLGNAAFLVGVARRPPRPLRSSMPGITGLVVIAGPDGAGKSTISEAIGREAERLGIPMRHVHGVPALLLPSRRSRRPPATAPHAKAPRGSLTSFAKVGVSFLEVVLALGGPWRRARREGLVVWERPWHDQVVDPVRYRLHPRAWGMAARLATRLPRADVLVLATGEPRAIHQRKPELSVLEVDRQLREWRRLAPDVAHAFVPVDTVQLDPGEAADASIQALERCAGVDRAGALMDWRAPLALPRRLDVVATAGRAAEPAMALYRPSLRRARIGMRVARTLHRFRLDRPASPPMPVEAVLSEHAPTADGWAVLRSSTPGRFVVGAAERGRLSVVAKVGAAHDDGLANEARMLESLAEQGLPFAVPRVRAWTRSGDWQLLLLDPVDLDLTGLTEERLLTLSTALARATQPVVHGDLAPWNVGIAGGQLVALDWERARFDDVPMYDLSHYVVQDGALLRSYGPRQAVHRLTGPGSLGARYLEALGQPPDAAAEFLHRYLASVPDDPNPRVERYRRQVERLLP